MTSEVNVALRGAPHRPAGHASVDALARARRRPICVTLHLGRPRRGEQRAPLARRHGDREFVVVAAAQHVGPQRGRCRQRTPRGGRQRHTLALDHDTKPRGVGDVAGIGQQAVGDIGRRRSQCRPGAGPASCAAAAGDNASRAPGSSIRPRAASRPSAPSPIVPLTQSSIARPRAGARQAAAARHAAEGGDGDGERSRRGHRVAAAQHDAVAALIGGETAGEARDPALAPAPSAATARADR